MRKPLMTVASVCLVAAGTLVSCSAPDSAPVESTATPTQITVPAELSDRLIPADSRVISNPADAQATLVLFTDYQCPYCAAMDELIQQAHEEYGDQVRIVVRNYPLPKHLNAAAAAQAVEAAAEQGALTEMSAYVFEHQKDWAAQSEGLEDLFVQYAQDLGLDTEQFRSDYSSQQIIDRVARDLQDARDLELPGTPTLILDGEVLQLKSVDYAELQESLESALTN